MQQFDPYDDACHDDPYAVYRHFRETDPVHFGAWPETGSWYLFRYDDVAAAFKNDRLGHDRGTHPPPPPLSIFRYADKFLNACDPPTHTRLRALVSGAFTPRVVGDMRPFTEQVMSALVKDRMDLVADLAGPLALRAVCHLLGVSIDDYEQFRGWSHDLSRLVEEATPQVVMRASQACDGLSARLADAIAERRAAPREDLLSNLVATDGRLSEDELIATCLLLLVAGHETTANLIGNGFLALLQHPDQLEALLADRSLVPAAIEELLRYDAPGRIAVRWARDDLEIGGRRIARGDRVALVVASANRDPVRFDDPDRLDVRRNPRHLSFGLGIHFGLGAPLARMEAEIVFSQLLTRRPRLDGVPRWQRRISMRGLQSLPVVLT